MRSLNGLVISLCQMNVAPNHPDTNANAVIAEMQKADARGVHIIAFPEECINGYFIGDNLEDIDFVRDVQRWNQRIIDETAHLDIAVIFGTVVCQESAKHEDGRHRLYNAGIVAQHGRRVGEFYKTLFPNYRIFRDRRHHLGPRELAQENDVPIDYFINPIPVMTPQGKILVGGMNCEDGWDDDYPIHPMQILARKGAEIIFDLSASPWTWQKNRKRHSVMRANAQRCGIPIVYVNNVGMQNTGKNIFVFDGSSTVYNRRGDIVFEVPPYAEGAHDVTFSERMPAIPEKSPHDAKELFDAAVCAAKEMLRQIPPTHRKIILGLSGGIDSATMAALWAHVVGPEHVYCYNMPFVYSDPSVKNLAATTAQRLGVHYEEKPIESIVHAIATLTDIHPGTLAYENIQARARMEVLAAQAQKIGGVFTCNGNKVEMAFGYGTMYADIAGFVMLFGDMVKREVRQLAEYMNREIYGHAVIPRACIDQVPSAELHTDQKDPFDYGYPVQRGYHDEWVRAVTEFRWNPEQFLEAYLNGTLERDLRLNVGHLRKLFPTDLEFINDLEHRWKQMTTSYFKRVQCPPVLIISRRAFGTDLEEFITGEAHFTQQYQRLRERILAEGPRVIEKVVVFGGAFDPPGRHHRIIAQALAAHFDRILIAPCGFTPDGRRDKDRAVASAADRKAMVELNFQNIPQVVFDFSDISGTETFTSTFQQERRYREQYPEAQIWFAIGTDHVRNGKSEESIIQRQWIEGKTLWNTIHFAVISPLDNPVDPFDLPPRAQIIPTVPLVGRSSEIRRRISRNGPVDRLLKPSVEQYILDRNLYRM